MGTVKAAFLSRINCPGFAVTAKRINTQTLYTMILVFEVGLTFCHTLFDSLYMAGAAVPMRVLISPERNRLQEILVSLAAVFSVVTQCPPYKSVA